MKIVFNYNNSDYPCPSRVPLFSPVSALFHPAILYNKNTISNIANPLIPNHFHPFTPSFPRKSNDSLSGNTGCFL